MTRYDQLASTERGTRTVLAVELYRLEKGALPESLDDLVPAYLDAVPNEHWAPIEPLRYERDASALGYRLYTVGSDGEDNGGTEPEGRMQDALTGRQPGTDFVFTRFPE